MSNIAPQSPQVDEDELKLGETDPARIAEGLAIAKALSVMGEWMIGSDSVVSAGGRRFSKPRDRSEAAEHLRYFSGKAMRLTSAVALAHHGALDWSYVDTAFLQVRPLSESFIESYLDAEWPEVGYTVGVFRLEGLGVQLFDRIDGDHFTILGMPLVPLLGALRERGLLAVMIKLALTGSIGMGKSTVARMFEAAGVQLFDADAVVRQLQGPGGALVERIGEAFPGTVRHGVLERDMPRADRARKSREARRARGNRPSGRG